MIKKAFLRLTNRDYSFVTLVSAVTGKLSGFLWAALGSRIFSLFLAWLLYCGQKARLPQPSLGTTPRGVMPQPSLRNPEGWYAKNLPVRHRYSKNVLTHLSPERKSQTIK